MMLQKPINQETKAISKNWKSLLTNYPKTQDLVLVNPERLKYFTEEIWSRRINKKDRVIYEIQDQQIIVVLLSALGHYSDK